MSFLDLSKNGDSLTFGPGKVLFESNLVQSQAFPIFNFLC